MKGVTGYLVAAIVIALLGAVLLTASRLERDMAAAEQRVATLRYDEVEATFDRAERYFQYASHLPGVGNGPVNNVRARKAALRYWQQQYDAIVPRQPDPVGAVASDNIELQRVVANAVFRTGMAQAKDRQSALAAIDAAISACLVVLRNAGDDKDAAFNYEYLVRLRDEFDKGRRKAGQDNAMKGPLGEPGSPPTIESNLSDFKIYIPLDSEERQENGAAGKAGPGQRKG
jgi:hypothetical protein